ncbi:MAG TPA: hypothetical protein VF106_02070 [Actinophytocola sp.]
MLLIDIVAVALDVQEPVLVEVAEVAAPMSASNSMSGPVVRTPHAAASASTTVLSETARTGAASSSTCRKAGPTTCSCRTQNTAPTREQAWTSAGTSSARDRDSAMSTRSPGRTPPRRNHDASRQLASATSA